MKIAIVNSRELDTNCWFMARFAEGIRCKQAYSCKYPERATCKAIETEIAYLEGRLSTLVVEYARKIDRLRDYKK